jgi:uncharacterized YccA/Bax inhibitor family protein
MTLRLVFVLYAYFRLHSQIVIVLAPLSFIIDFEVCHRLEQQAPYQNFGPQLGLILRFRTQLRVNDVVYIKKNFKFISYIKQS